MFKTVINRPIKFILFVMISNYWKSTSFLLLSTDFFTHYFPLPPSQFEKHWVRVRDAWKEGIFEAPHYSVFTAKLTLKHTTSVIKKCQRRVLQLALRVELTTTTSIANSKIKSKNIAHNN